MKDFANIISWYILAGVDEICDEQTHNFLTVEATSDFAEKNRNKNENYRPATTLLAQESTAACLNAHDLCDKAQNLDELKTMVENFKGCTLKFSANSTVFGFGNYNADVMIIGEAPGADEDRIGKPFVGRSGQLLNKMLAAISLKREDCYITNVLPWRPPGNRTPTDSEVAVCLPFLEKQIELVNPQIILLLGASAAAAVLKVNEGISALRGHLLSYKMANGEQISVIASFHPAYLLRSGSQKAKAWSDMLRLQRELAE